MGDGVRARPAPPRARGHARLPRPRAGARDRRDGPQPALPDRRPTCAASPRPTIAEAPIADAELVVVAVPSAVFGAVVDSLPGDAPILSLTKGLDPATGERLSTLVRGRPVRRALRPEHRRGDRRRPARRGGDLERRTTSLSLALQRGDQLVHLPRLRQRRRRRRRALRGGEERDRARGRRGRRPRASATTRRRRSSRAGWPRWRGSRSPPAAARRRSRASRDGRPRRHLLVEVRPKPPCRAS